MPRYKIEKDRQVPYTPEEAEYRAILLQEVETARKERDDSHDNFDGMTYLEYYESNAMAARSFNPARKNEGDTRIVTGMTEEKVNTMLSSALSYNFEPNFEAYDQEDNLMDSLGETMEDMVRKSRDIEMYNSKRRLIYKEALDQGDAFVEEVWEHPVALTKEVVETVYDSTSFNNYEWNDKIEVLRGEAKVNQIDGRNVFPGNIRLFSLEDQQMIVTREVVPYEQVARLYSEWERFKYVPKKFSSTTMNYQIGSIYEDYSMYTNNTNEVEIIKVQKKYLNEYQIFLNGVMMLPPQFPLSFVNGLGSDGLAKYNIVKLSINPIGHNFFYSKSIPAKTKVKQGVADELLRLMVLKTQQSFKPPMANNTGFEFSDDVTRPGNVIDDIDPDQLQPIIKPTGVTNSEYNMYTLIQKEISDVSTSDSFGGQSDPNVKTATDAMLLQKQNTIKLTSVLLGITLYEERIANLRRDTILKNWTQPIDKNINELKGSIDNVYRKMSVDTENKKGEKVRKMIEFVEDMPDKYELYGKAMKMKKKIGKKVTMVVLDPILLSLVRYFWKTTIVPTQTDTTALDRELLFNDIAVAQKILEPQGIKLNYNYLSKEMARVMDKDPSKFFIQDDITDIMMTQAPGQEEEGGKKTDAVEDILRNPVGKQVAENMVPGGKGQPSTRELINAKK